MRRGGEGREGGGGKAWCEAGEPLSRGHQMATTVTNTTMSPLATVTHVAASGKCHVKCQYQYHPESLLPLPQSQHTHTCQTE